MMNYLYYNIGFHKCNCKKKSFVVKYPKVIYMKQKLQGSISLLLATVIWGGAFVAQSAGMAHIGPFTFQAVRCFLAVLALVLVIALLEIHDLKSFIRRWADKQLWKAGLICGLALFVSTSLQQIGLVDTDAGKAGFITAMYIVIVPILGLFIGRKTSVAAVFSILLAVVGMYLLCCAGVTQIGTGDLLILGCAVAFAVQILLVDVFAPSVDPLRLNTVQALVVAVLSALFMFATETPDMDLITSCWLPLTYAGVLSMGAAYSLQIIGQKKLEPTAASLIMSLESVFAVLFGSLILHETMTLWESMGCVLVFAAVILSQIPIQKKAKALS